MVFKKYNLSEYTAGGDFVQLAQATNTTLAGYFFGYFILVSLFFAMFISLKNKGQTNAASFSAAMWVCMFVSWMLRAMSLIDNNTFWGVTILTAGSVLVLFLSGGPD